MAISTSLGRKKRLVNRFLRIVQTIVWIAASLCLLCIYLRFAYWPIGTPPGDMMARILSTIVYGESSLRNTSFSLSSGSIR
mgnify:CR=1 FL=1